MWRKGTLAGCAGLAVAAAAVADVPNLVNTDFEQVNPINPALPVGWELLNTARYRAVGDGLNPPALARSGTHSIELPAGNPFSGATSDEPVDPADPLSQLNFETIIYPGVDYKVSGWYAIPDGMPLGSGAQSGLKVEFRRGGGDFSIFEAFEYLSIRQHDTDGQFVYYEFVVTSEQLDTIFRAFPPGPARVSVLPIRVGPVEAPTGGTGTIFWDDLDFAPVQQESTCRADFDNQNGVQVADIFAFLRAWFAGCP